MSYRSLHKTLERWELFVLWGLIAAFLIAVALMFVHATAALAMVWLGMIVLVIAFGVVKVLQRLERAAARKDLKDHHCPACGADVQHADDGWHCSSCGAAFTDAGATLIT